MNQAVITGGGGTLAQAIAAELVTSGISTASPTRQELDVADKSSIRSFFSKHSPELLICAAGIIRDAPIMRTDEIAWDEVVTVNYKGAAACVKEALPGMIEKRRGHIIFISSFSAIHPPVGQIAYSSAKAALLGLTADLASEYGNRNIRVNAVLPGFLETRMTEKVSPERRGEILAAHVIQSFNTPEAVGKFIRHLHHDLPFTSGQVFQLDSRIP